MVWAKLPYLGGICGQIDVFWYILAKNPQLIVAEGSLEAYWGIVFIENEKKIKKIYFFLGGGGAELPYLG